MKALERCGFTDFETNKSILPFVFGTPDWVQIGGLQSRSLALYPTELRAHIKDPWKPSHPGQSIWWGKRDFASAYASNHICLHGRCHTGLPQLQPVRNSSVLIRRPSPTLLGNGFASSSLCLSTTPQVYLIIQKIANGVNLNLIIRAHWKMQNAFSRHSETCRQAKGNEFCLLRPIYGVWIGTRFYAFQFKTNGYGLPENPATPLCIRVFSCSVSPN